MRYLTLALVATVCAWPAAAYADELPLDLTVTIDNQTEVFENLEGTLGPDGVFRGRGDFDGEGFEVQYNFRGDLDPALTVSVSVTDVGAPSVFSFLFALPVANIPAPTITGGSVGGSITDGTGNGATLSSTGGQSVYTALVNGSPFQTMLTNPFSLSATDPFSTVSIPVESFGLPGLTVPGPGATVTLMAIQLQFALSGGDDAAALTANFVVEPGETTVIPEPATLTLLGLGVAGMAGRALRRRMMLAA